MTRKRIILVPAWFPSNDHPQDGIFFFEQAQALATQHDVIVVRPSLASFRSLGDATLTSSTRDGLDQVESRALPRIPRSQGASVKALARATERGMQAAAQQLGGEPDLVLAMHADPAGWQAFKVAQKMHWPFVLSEHASFTETFAQLPHYPEIQQTFAGADALTVPSAFLAEKIQTQGLRDQATVIPNLVRTDFFTPGDAPAGNPIIFAAGNLTAVKGFDLLIEAFAQVRQAPGKKPTLIIAGEGPLRAELQTQIKKYQLMSDIRLLGRLTREQLREAYRNCTLFVCSSSRETFSIVLAEAMACGKPVVSTHCGGPEAFVNKSNGVLVESGPASELARGIDQVLTHLNDYDPGTISKGVEAFGRPAFLDRYQVVFEALSQQKGPA